MKTIRLTLAIAVVACVVLESASLPAQILGRHCRQRGLTIYAGQDAQGVTLANDVGYVSPRQAMHFARQNHFSPHPYYTYSNPGITAQLTHQWNQSEAMVRPWHGGYSNWEWGTPTAVVVPATAAYHTSYAWGVGQVRSTPIHHQFGRYGAGMIGGGEGLFSNTPYWPSSTEQFGLYPVRAPW